MPYKLTVPTPMRVFTPVQPGVHLVGKTSTCKDVGEVLDISATCMVSYDHQVKLAIELITEPTCYLLLEELDERLGELSCEWTQWYEQSFYAKEDSFRASVEAKINELYVQIRPLLRKYIRPTFAVVKADADSKAPTEKTSLRTVPLLHAA